MAGLREEERRLRRIFARAMCLALAAPALAVPFACGDDHNVASDLTTSSTGSGDQPDAGEDDGDAAADAPSIFEAGCEPVSFYPVPEDVCGLWVHLPCGFPPVIDPTKGGGCYLLIEDCNKICPDLFFNCHAPETSCDAGVIVPDPSGNVDIDCAICNGAGRATAGLAPGRMRRPRSALGAYFATAAYLEATSVHAFRRLRSELAAHGAPAPLRRAALRAERDEVRHTRAMARVARRFGAGPARPTLAELPTRALEVVAVENAVEGCVRETYGALVATWQSAHAADVEVARAMQSISRDETRHAALSWRVARWAWGRLDEATRRRLVARCRDAVASLRDEAERGVAAEVARVAGLPSREQRRRLLDGLEADLWSTFAA